MDGLEGLSIEIYYDTATIPTEFGDPLTFRNAAMAVVEDALEKAGAGEWAGAEYGAGEVNFGFDVENFDVAEAIVRRAVAGTPYANIREIVRTDYADFA